MRRAIAVLVLLLIAVPLAAQDCGEGVPCGPLPWELPRLPALESPTPLPTIVVEPTMDSGSPPDPTATPESPVDTGEVESGLDQAQDLLESTEVPVAGVDGEPFDMDSIDGEEDLTDFFALLKGVAGGSFGIFTPMVTLFFAGFVMVLVMQAAAFFIPIAAVIFGFIRRIITLILDFLPF